MIISRIKALRKTNFSDGVNLEKFIMAKVRLVRVGHSGLCRHEIEQRRSTGGEFHGQGALTRSGEGRANRNDQSRLPGM